MRGEGFEQQDLLALALVGGCAVDAVNAAAARTAVVATSRCNSEM
jgi:hypothetical protein